MRFERHGGSPNLQAAFKKLILEHLHGRALDDNQNEEAAAGKFPDFACFSDLVLIEMKHLETEQADRINEVFDKNIDPEEKPIFFGERDAKFITDVISNGEEVKAIVASKLSRTIEKILSKANKQFCDYRTRHPRKNSVNICVVLNSTLQEYTPELVGFAIHGKMKTSQHVQPRFSQIDAVIYISEKHFQVLSDGRTAMAMLIYEGIGVLHHPWKSLFVQRVFDSWSRMRTGESAVPGGFAQGFKTVEDIPDTMRLSEVWQLEYQRNPYLENFTMEGLRVHFNRVAAVNSLSFLKGGWPKPSKEKTLEGLRAFGHVIEETNRRGLDLRMLNPRLLSSAEKIEVYSGLPDELVTILSRQDENDSSNGIG